jgi:hypothetical protein
VVLSNALHCLHPYAVDGQGLYVRFESSRDWRWLLPGVLLAAILLRNPCWPASTPHTLDGAREHGTPHMPLALVAWTKFTQSFTQRPICFTRTALLALRMGLLHATYVTAPVPLPRCQTLLGEVYTFPGLAPTALLCIS